MCDGHTGPASQGYEARDAADFAAAGVDMLKVDSCGGGEAVDKYGKYVDTEEQGMRQRAQGVGGGGRGGSNLPVLSSF